MRQSGFKFLEELFFMHIPCPGNIPSRQPTGRTRLSKAIGTLITACTCYDISSFIRISGSPEKSDIALLGISKVIIVRIAFTEFFESKVIKERYFTILILHTPPVKTIRRTILGIRLHTCIDIDNMRIVEHIIIRSCSTKIIAQHFVLCRIVETSFR